MAVPRRQPRDARRLTPGSIASDRNSETSRSRNSAERLVHTERVTIETMYPSQKMATAFHTHRGMRSGGNHGRGSDITAERSDRLPREGWRPDLRASPTSTRVEPEPRAPSRAARGRDPRPAARAARPAR